MKDEMRVLVGETYAPPVCTFAPLEDFSLQTVDAAFANPSNGKFFIKPEQEGDERTNPDRRPMKSGNTLVRVQAPQ